MPEKAPLFIKAFIEQNQDFFRYDPVINDWIALLETGVCFNTPASTNDEQLTLGTDDKQEEALESSEGSTPQHHDWSDFHLQDVFNTKSHYEDQGSKSPLP